MPPVRLLLSLGLCWSAAAASQSGSGPRPGFVTDYITPMANLSVDKLVGRWYVAEYASSGLPQVPPNITAALCLITDYHYDDNGTLVVEPITLIAGVRSSPVFALPVSENGVSDFILDGVTISSGVVVDLSEDNRFLAMASCKSVSTKFCVGLVLVRHIEDAGRDERLAELHRRLTRAGVDNADVGLVKAIEPCRLIATPSPDLSADNGPSTPDTE